MYLYVVNSIPHWKKYMYRVGPSIYFYMYGSVIVNHKSCNSKFEKKFKRHIVQDRMRKDHKCKKQ